MPGYVCGRGDDGQLGLQQPKDSPFTIVPFFSDKRIIQAASGSGHSLYLCDQNEVFTCGRDHGDSHCQYEPKRVDYFHTHGISVASIACGSYHSAAISTKGELYTW